MEAGPGERAGAALERDRAHHLSRGVAMSGQYGEEGRDVSGQYGKRDETCPISTGGRGGAITRE